MSQIASPQHQAVPMDAFHLGSTTTNATRCATTRGADGTVQTVTTALTSVTNRRMAPTTVACGARRSVDTLASTGPTRRRISIRAHISTILMTALVGTTTVAIP